MQILSFSSFLDKHLSIVARESCYVLQLYFMHLLYSFFAPGPLRSGSDHRFGQTGHQEQIQLNLYNIATIELFSFLGRSAVCGKNTFSYLKEMLGNKNNGDVSFDDSEPPCNELFLIRGADLVYSVSFMYRVIQQLLYRYAGTV